MPFTGRALAGLLFVAAVASPANADPNVSVHLGAAVARNMTRETCARKAVQLMAKEHFLYAGVDKEGNVRGWSAKASVAVVPLPNPDGVFFLVVAAGSDCAEAERLRNVIRAQLLEAPLDPNAPRLVGKVDPERRAKVPAIRWRVRQQSLVRTMQYFAGGAGIVLEKEGINVAQSDNGFVLGAGRGCVASVWTAPGPNALTVHLGGLAVGWDDATARQRADALCRAIVKLLYE
jgi:hypothetical protein